MTPRTRPVSWIRAALKEFETFPEGARSICLTALTIAAEGGKADIAKPMHSMESGVFEVALPFRGDAFRVVYAVQLAEEIWVVHAFRKKSTRGIKTPQREIELVKYRLKTLKAMPTSMSSQLPSQNLKVSPRLGEAQFIKFQQK